MKKERILPCYYPTTVILIDDKRKYLLGLKSVLNKNRASYLLYANPKAALDFLTEKYQSNPFTHRCVLHPEEDELDHRNIEVNVRAIADEIYNPHRFEQISVLVVDQEMPGLKGLDLCRQLMDSPIKKLLLTGEVEDKQEVQAFNDGIIDKFINKKADDFSEILNHSIAELQKAYFHELSAIIIDSLTQNPEHHPKSSLADPDFIRFFSEFCKQHQFTEYYLADTSGSFLFLDSAGHPSWLVVKNEEEMEASYYLAEVADKKLSPSTMKSLKKREKILFLHDQEDYQLDAGDWESHSRLHPAKKFVGNREVYYYAYIDDPMLYKVNVGEIFSFKSYSGKLGS